MLRPPYSQHSTTQRLRVSLLKLGRQSPTRYPLSKKARCLSSLSQAEILADDGDGVAVGDAVEAEL
jgi:hypothetical protein